MSWLSEESFQDIDIRRTKSRRRQQVLNSTGFGNRNSPTKLPSDGSIPNTLPPGFTLRLSLVRTVGIGWYVKSHIKPSTSFTGLTISSFIVMISRKSCTEGFIVNVAKPPLEHGYG